MCQRRSFPGNNISQSPIHIQTLKIRLISSFKQNMTSNLGPFDFSLVFTGLPANWTAYNPHCLKRDLNNYIATRYGNQPLSTFLWRLPTSRPSRTQYQAQISIWVCMEVGIFLLALLFWTSSQVPRTLRSSFITRILIAFGRFGKRRIRERDSMR